MFDYSFIDLDDTLFSTYIFKKDIFGCFAMCGVTPEDYQTTYKRAVFGPVVGYFDYTFKKHADILREIGYEIPDQTVDNLNDLFKKDYKDPQAEEFLVALKKVSNKLILLTAGDKNMQQKKIDSTGLAKYFDEIVIIDGGKGSKITDVAGEAEKVLFVNDNLIENLQIKNELPKVLVVAKKNPTLWTEEDYQTAGMPYFYTLNEIKDYVSRSI